jgi:prevent-host-death family protein
MTVSAKNAKNNFGRVLDEARRTPVLIEKNGRRVAVLLSIEEYEELEAQRDAHWALKAAHAERQGHIGARKSAQILRNALNARD